MNDIVKQLKEHLQNSPVPELEILKVLAQLGYEIKGYQVTKAETFGKDITIHLSTKSL